MTRIPPTHIEVEGDKPKVERTRHYFAALVAGLKTAQEYAAELKRLAADAERYKLALEQIRDGFDGDEFQDSADAYDQHREIARAALEGNA